MTKGPRRLVLDHYLDSAAPGAVSNAGRDWKEKADDLQELGEALRDAALQAELRIGEQTLTGPALRAGMEKSSASMLAKSEQLRAAGEALRQVGQQLADTRDARDALADLGDKPSPYQAPAGTPGVEPTPEEIKAQADASQARANERGAWQTQYDQQEAKSLALTKEMDAAFLGAIPPMKDIHGQQDPTEPPPSVPSGPGGTYLPGSQAPPPTGGGNGGGDGSGDGSGKPTWDGGKDDGGKPTWDDGKDDGKDDGGKDKPPPPPTVITTPTTIETTHTTVPTTHGHTEGPTSTVTGTSQDGITYQPGSSPHLSAPAASAGSSSGATSAAAFGAAGGAGGLAAGAVRPGSVPTSAGATPARAIGSTGRAGSPGALSRAAGSTVAGRSAGSAGSPAARSAGSAAGRGASTGSTSGRGGAGARGASGSGSGARSGGRGSSGARSAGSGGSGGRGGRKGERDTTTDRDSLVYDQDWLGDDDVAPGVLD